MQVVENLSQLSGTILSRQRHPQLDDFDVLTVKVDDVAPVEGVADLLSSTRGTELPVTVRRQLLDHLAAPGAAIHLRAKRTPDGAMAETYPESGNFRVVSDRPELSAGWSEVSED